MTRQDIFDVVVTHLRRQVGRSYNEDTMECQYFGEEGKRCAVGVLLPAEVQASAMGDEQGGHWNETGVPGIPRDIQREYLGVPPREGNGTEWEEAMGFLNRLQTVHDRRDNWGTDEDEDGNWTEGRFNRYGESELLSVAKAYGVKVPEAK